MKYGVSIFPTDTSIRPDTLAREVEARGFESLWFPEHSHIPTSRESPWGGREGSPPLPEQYWRTMDQFVALAYAASATSELRVGTGINLLAQRDPIWTAKEVASLDHLSGGRVTFGVGYGWNKEEMAHHGVEYAERRQLLREKVSMMKALWTEEEASFSGEKLKLESSWSWPKPIQSPHPPIVLGAAIGPKTLTDLADFCDGWIAIAATHDVSGNIARVREAVADAGRDPSRFEVTAQGAKLRYLERYEEAGVDRAVFSLPPLGPEVVIPKLDEWAEGLGL
jgi:probable F420-dependent oxidoreductase